MPAQQEALGGDEEQKLENAKRKIPLRDQEANDALQLEGPKQDYSYLWDVQHNSLRTSPKRKRGKNRVSVLARASA